MKFIKTQAMEIAKTRLVSEQRVFAKTPTSGAWNRVLEAMFIHQQLTALKFKTDRLQELSSELVKCPTLTWPDVISQRIFSQSYAQVMAAQ